jgi:amidohydrolase
MTYLLLMASICTTFARDTPRRVEAHQAPQADIVRRLNDETPALVALYKHLHAHPELAMQEEKTAARLAKEMRAAGFDVAEKVGGTGVVAVLKNGAGPTILVRADMDGLPIEEQTGLPYASKERVRDRDGLDVGVMHACGHDVNVTCLVGTARVLAGMKDRWKGTLVFIGQPAEETGQGAKAMLDAGLFEKFPRPDYGLALHCDARYPHGHVNYRVGQLQANVDSVDITVRGRGGHGAAPQTTIDPVVLAARMVLDLQTLVSRERDPFEPVVVTVGSIHGGTKHNIIPSEVKLQLTVRTMTDASRKTVLEGIARIVRGVAASAGAPEPLVRHAAGEYTPALVNHPELARKMIALLKDVVGPERVHERPPSMGGEDFSRYGLAGVPTFYYHLGSVAPERIAAAQKGGPPLPQTHSAFYYPIPEPTICTGVLTMSLAVLELLSQGTKVPVLFDTDIGDDIDDAFALALLVASPEIDLRGVTTAFGDTHTRALIACRILHAAGRKDIPVAAGRATKQSGEPRGQMKYGVPAAGVRQPEKEPAVEFLYRQLKAHPGELTLLAVGPLTNISDLLTRHPDCKPWIKRLVIMGGSVRVGYDGKPMPEVEWNIKCDVRAAQVVFASGVPLIVAPLDATGTLQLDSRARRRIFEARTPWAEPLLALYQLWGQKRPVLFDPVAAMLSITDRFCKLEDLRLVVDDQGNTRIAQGQANARVATAIQGDAMLAWFVERLTREHSQPARRVP